MSSTSSLLPIAHDKTHAPDVGALCTWTPARFVYAGVLGVLDQEQRQVRQLEHNAALVDVGGRKLKTIAIEA
jgi:hypothetical protein